MAEGHMHASVVSLLQPAASGLTRLFSFLFFFSSFSLLWFSLLPPSTCPVFACHSDPPSTHGTSSRLDNDLDLTALFAPGSPGLSSPVDSCVAEDAAIYWFIVHFLRAHSNPHELIPAPITSSTKSIRARRASEQDETNKGASLTSTKRTDRRILRPYHENRFTHSRSHACPPFSTRAVATPRDASISIANLTPAAGAAGAPPAPPLPTISSPIPDTTTTTKIIVRAPQSTPGFQAIPSTYQGQDSSLPPATVAGIVLGSVGGFLLLLALLYSCTGWTPVFIPWSPWRKRTVVVEEHRHKDHHRRRRRRRRSSRGTRTETEMFEVRRTTSGSGRPPHVRGVPVAPQPPPPPHVMMPGVRVSQSTTRHGPPSRGRAGRFDDATTATETDMTEEEDEVVVIEEHSPPRHKSSRRSSRPRSYDSRRDSRRYDRR
ncbi:hypothetical protein ISF_05544 [Cordyceps fumosorosea ARSEF 2679]|uniref:Uncharacterized protein n=1 Tax=Cordyceps fumosorosea (strain ARSEF 2679) TaxID=1081104 RepID=A0A167UD37_CORFA|nr:hypothetical protein ISF_05544 [Cordyceps fumosorosea ARSEF 2679]OAA61465.1 hypothetical protein ISF_05544 [Cordyceps fumosorosea ARSEF 2679]